jgi:SAM-dependent methyltransferase
MSTVSNDAVGQSPAAPSGSSDQESDSSGSAAGAGGVVYFDELAELFDRFAVVTDALTRSWLEETLPDLSGVAGSRAVDLGCGTGRYLSLLAGRHAEVLGVDVSERSLRIARTKLGVPGGTPVQAGDRADVPAGGAGAGRVRLERRGLLEVSPDEDGRFDAVLSVNTVHQADAATGEVVAHLRRLVAPGGWLVVVDLIDPGEWASRDWQIASAFGQAEQVFRDGGGVPAVFDVLRLRLHPTWLAHSLADIPLTRDRFEATYRSLLPGVDFTSLHDVVIGARWHKPTDEHPAAGGAQ